MRTYAPLNNSAEELAAAFAMNNSDFAKGEAEAIAAQFKHGGNSAKARKYNAGAALDEYRLQQMKQGRNDYLSAATGLREDQLAELLAAMQSGYQQPAEGDSAIVEGEQPTTMQKPEYLTPELERRLNTARQTLALNDVSTGNTNAEQLAKTMGLVRGHDMQDQIIEGSADPNDIAAAMAATAGKAFEVHRTTNDVDGRGQGGKGNVQAVQVGTNPVTGQPMFRRLDKRTGQWLDPEPTYLDPQAMSMAEKQADNYVSDKAGWLTTDANDFKEYRGDRKAARKAETARLYQIMTGQPFPTEISTALEQPAPAQPTPFPGARQAADGQWYVQKDGQYMRVVEDQPAQTPPTSPQPVDNLQAEIAQLRLPLPNLEAGHLQGQDYQRRSSAKVLLMQQIEQLKQDYRTGVNVDPGQLRLLLNADMDPYEYRDIINKIRKGEAA